MSFEVNKYKINFLTPCTSASMYTMNAYDYNWATFDKIAGTGVGRETLPRFFGNEDATEST